jgi:RNA polymerase sigma-70 factor (ECF subfamily)
MHSRNKLENCKKGALISSLDMTHLEGNKEDHFVKEYERLSDPVFRFCLFKVSNRDVALDITQETFTKTWEYIEAGHTIENMKAFLYRTAGNLVIDYHRKKKAVSLDSLQENGFDIGVMTNEKNEIAFDTEVVLKVVATLDEKYRDVVLLRYAEDMSVKDIAEMFGETENTISVRIHRALEKVKEVFEIYGKN